LAKKIVVRQDGEEGERTNGTPIICDGELLVITAGYPLNKPGTTNLVKLHRVV
jgi:pyruvate kinase